MDTVEQIFKLLTKGGIWINFGPLIYDYCCEEERPIIEVSWDNLRYFILNIGFNFLKEEIVTCPFSQSSLCSTVFQSIYTIAIK